MKRNDENVSVGRWVWWHIVSDCAGITNPQFVTLTPEQITAVRRELAELWEAQRKLYLAYDTKQDRTKYGRAWNAVRSSIVAAAKAAKDNPTVKMHLGFPLGIDKSRDGIPDHELITLKPLAEHEAERKAAKAAEEAETEAARAELAAEQAEAATQAELDRLSTLDPSKLAAELWDTISASGLDADVVMAELSQIAASRANVANAN
jgi:hypothetical protein